MKRRIQESLSDSLVRRLYVGAAPRRFEMGMTGGIREREFIEKLCIKKDKRKNNKVGTNPIRKGS